MSTICADLKGTSVLENVYVQGKLVANAKGMSDVSMVIINKEDTTTVKNVIVDFDNTYTVGKSCGLTVYSADSTDKIQNITNCYTIGTTKNICYVVANGTVIDGVTYTWGTWMPITGSTGGYADDAAFLEAYNANNDMINSNVFAVAEEGGATVLQFYNTALKQFRTVKTFSSDANA